MAVPEPVKLEMESAQTELRHALPSAGVRWTRRDQFHLTLKFLGGVPADQTAPLAESVADVCRDFPPLPLRAERIGFFPDERFPRVIWAGVHDATELLPKFQLAIAAAAQAFTAEKTEGSFSGHVTLGRVNFIKRPSAELLARFAHGMAGRFFGAWTADRVGIFRSELTPGGARYATLAEIPLSKKI